MPSIFKQVQILAVAGLLSLAASAAKASTPIVVFSGFSALGPGVVTSSNGPGQDAPPIGLNTLNVGSLQLYDPLAAHIAPDATGTFSFDRSQGNLEVRVQNQDYPAFPISGWSFSYPGSTVDVTLDHGVVTDFHFHGLAFADSHGDLTPDTFSVHFDNVFQVYDFSGSWSPTSVSTATQSFIVPEPTEWALLIVGFGLTGLVIRGRGFRRTHLGAVPS